MNNVESTVVDFLECFRDSKSQNFPGGGMGPSPWGLAPLACDTSAFYVICGDTDKPFFLFFSAPLHYFLTTHFYVGQNEHINPQCDSGFIF